MVKPKTYLVEVSDTPDGNLEIKGKTNMESESNKESNTNSNIEQSENDYQKEGCWGAWCF